MGATIKYRYPAQSEVDAGSVLLAAALGPEPMILYRGSVQSPETVASALLCVAGVARTRFFMSVAELRQVLDPVITSEPAGLHIESFSSCCGVHARLDLHQPILGTEIQRFGTVSVDFNPPMRAALARVHGREPLRLQVGLDAVEISTRNGHAVERRVSLPERWVRGFAEVQAAAINLPFAYKLDARTAQRFLRSLPRGKAGTTNYWARHHATGIRLTSLPGGGAVWLSGPERLRPLEPLIRHIRSLRVFAEPDTQAPSIWAADLGDAQLLLSLSLERTRGFSGEGGTLYALADAQAEHDEQLLDRELRDHERFGRDEIAGTGLTRARAVAALTRLGAEGHLGYDPVSLEWYRRELPFPKELLHSDPPRLRDARELVATGAVQAVSDEALVTGTQATHHVRLDPPRCTCRWWQKHPGDRGPCKHILAALLATNQSATEAG